MLLVLSPSKTLDLESKITTKKHSVPDMLDESEILIGNLRKYSNEKLMDLMDISQKLAELNTARYKAFKTPFTAANSRPALFTFKGDVYEGIEVENYSAKDLEFAQNHVRILSGLYGLLRPLDLMQAYRLEMGIDLKNPRGKNLYEFWGDRITEKLNKVLEKQKAPLLVNLASNEYFKAVRPKKLQADILNIDFKENKDGKHKIIGLFAKQARGQMANFIIKNQISDPEALKKFTIGGYKFSKSDSCNKNFIFLR